MKMNAKAPLFLLLVGTLISALSINATAGMRFEFAYTSRPADVRVWMSTGDARYYDNDYYTEDDYYEGGGYGQQEYDVYPAVDNVVLNVRASRSCYVTVYLVDADGYIHVVHPLSPHESAYLRGGRVYRFHLGELGFYGDVFGRGVAFAYAVASPVPFVYSSYGLNVFGPNWGFRIHGDPYVASRQFYVNLVGGRCDIGLIGVSHSRFYVRDYTRYPSYLCVGWHNYYGVRTVCRGDCSVHRHYRMHARAPYRVLHPRQRLGHEVGRHTRIARADHEPNRELRVKTTRKRVSKVEYDQGERMIHRARKPGYDEARARKITGQSVASRTAKTRNVDNSRVVRSSKGSFVKSKSDISVMRQQLEKRNEKTRVSQSRDTSGARRKVAPAGAAKAGTKKREVRADAHSKKGSKVKQSPHASGEEGKGKKKQSKDAKSSRKAEHGKR